MRSRFRRLPVIAGVTIAIALAAVGVFAPFLATHDPYAVNVAAISVPPIWYADGDWNYVLGGDHLGRDVLSRFVTSFRIYPSIGVVGALLGTLAAWLLVIARSIRGAAATPNIPRRLLSVSFPVLAIITFITGAFLYIPLVVVVGASLPSIVVYTGVLSSLLPMILVYESVRGDGASSSPIRLAVRRGVALSPVGFSLALLMGLFIDSFSSFLGVGVQPPTPSLGYMLLGIRNLEIWWVWSFPLGVLLVAVGAFSAIVIPVGRGLIAASRSIPAGPLPIQGGTPAGLWIRLAAYLIDFAAFVALTILLVILFIVYDATIGLKTAFVAAILS